MLYTIYNSIYDVYMIYHVSFTVNLDVLTQPGQESGRVQFPGGPIDARTCRKHRKEFVAV